jgi:hypothetical protein
MAREGSRPLRREEVEADGTPRGMQGDQGKAPPRLQRRPPPCPPPAGDDGRLCLLWSRQRRVVGRLRMASAAKTLPRPAAQYSLHLVRGVVHAGGPHVVDDEFEGVAARQQLARRLRAPGRGAGRRPGGARGIGARTSRASVRRAFRGRRCPPRGRRPHRCPLQSRAAAGRSAQPPGRPSSPQTRRACHAPRRPLRLARPVPHGPAHLQPLRHRVFPQFDAPVPPDVEPRDLRHPRRAAPQEADGDGDRASARQEVRGRGADRLDPRRARALRGQVAVGLLQVPAAQPVHVGERSCGRAAEAWGRGRAPGEGWDGGGVEAGRQETRHKGWATRACKQRPACRAAAPQACPSQPRAPGNPKYLPCSGCRRRRTEAGATPPAAPRPWAASAAGRMGRSRAPGSARA